MRTPRIVSWVLTGFLIGLCSAGVAVAEEEKKPADDAKPADPEAAQEQQKQASGEDLAQQARNPTASVTMMQVLVDHTSGFHNLEGADQTRLVLLPVIPFQLGKTRHIARVTLPWVVEGPDWGTLAEQDQGNVLPPNYVPTADKTGLGDTALFDILIFNAPWKGRYFLGVSAILPTATDPALGTEKWSLGPAGGVLFQSGKLMLGGLVLTNFSVAGKSDRDDVRMLSLQAFGSYGLGNSWSLEASQMMYSYDFNTSRWTSLPLGVRIGKMVTFGKQPVRLFADAEYNFADTGVAPAWTFRFAVVPLL